MYDSGNFKSKNLNSIIDILLIYKYHEYIWCPIIFIVLYITIY